MKINRSTSRLLSLLIALVLITFAGCKKDDGPPEIPEDSDPQVTLLSPSQNYILAWRGDVVNISFRLDDNEQLNTFKLSETWTSIDGTDYIKFDDIIMGPQIISGTHIIQPVSYSVPLPQIQDYSTITLKATITDNKGKSASTTFRINVLPEPGSVPAYEIQEYTDEDTIHSVLIGNMSNFSFLQKSNKVTIQAEFDIGEASVNPLFTAELICPNQGSKDSVIVMTDALHFNFDSLTYETMWQAFITSNRIGDMSDPLKAGDIVIVKMITPPHYACMRINSVDKGAGEIRFTYKYSKN